MMKRFWVFILLFLAASFTLADDMPPLPSDAPASAVPAKDSGMPALPDAAASSATPAGANDMPALPDAGSSAAPAKAGANDMPALPDAGAAAVPAKAGSNDMPALPDSSAPAKAAPTTAGSSDMPALPDSSAPAKAEAPKAAASPTDSDMNTVPMDDGSAAAPTKAHESKPWLASKERPLTRFKGWIHSKGGNTTSKLSWASQQVLNVMDEKHYKMDKEEGVYEGERDKGPQYRKFTFIVPKTKDQVLVLLKEDKKRILFVVGPDEDPAPADHTYAQVAKMRAEDMRVWQIIKAKFGSRIKPYKMVPSWDAPYDRNKGTADE